MAIGTKLKGNINKSQNSGNKYNPQRYVSASRRNKTTGEWENTLVPKKSDVARRLRNSSVSSAYEHTMKKADKGGVGATTIKQTVRGFSDDPVTRRELGAKSRVNSFDSAYDSLPRKAGTRARGSALREMYRRNANKNKNR